MNWSHLAGGNMFGCKRKKLTLSLVWIGLVLCQPASRVDGRQIAELVDDLRPGTDYASGAFGGSWGAELVSTQLFFMQRDELWVTEGTPLSTSALVVTGGSRPIAAAASGDYYFWMESRGQPDELWQSDGTVAGTIRLISDTLTDWLVSYAGGVVYLDHDGSKYNLVWSDGTEGGTYSLADLDEYPWRPVVLGSHLYFRTSAIQSSQLWRASPDERSGEMVAYLPEAYNLVAASERFFFATVDRSLWTSDGTQRGTYALTRPAYDGEVLFFQIVPAGDGAYFTASPMDGGPPRLWYSDGSRQRTRPLTPREGGPAPVSELGFSLSSRVLDSGRLVFVGAERDGSWALWSAGTTRDSLRRIAGPNTGIPLSERWWSGIYNDWPSGTSQRAFFVGESNSSLWSTDGTSAGTYRLLDLPSGARHITINDSIEGSNAALVSVSGYASPIGLYRSDGTPEGTWPIWSEIEDRIPSASDGVALLDGSWIVVSNWGEMFRIPDAPASPAMVVWSNFPSGRAGSHPDPLIALGERLLLTTCMDGDRAELRSIKSGSHEIVRLAELGFCRADWPTSRINHLWLAEDETNKRVFVASVDIRSHRSIVATDGTYSGTSVIAEGGGGVVGPAIAANLGWWIQDYPYQVWSSTGTTDGTELRATLDENEFSYVARFESGLGGLIVAGKDSKERHKLWWISADASELRVLWEGGSEVIFGSSRFLDLGDELFFSLRDDDVSQLWQVSREPGSAQEIEGISGNCSISHLQLYEGDPIWIEQNCDISRIYRWIDGEPVLVGGFGSGDSFEIVGSFVYLRVRSPGGSSWLKRISVNPGSYSEIVHTFAEGSPQPVRGSLRSAGSEVIFVARLLHHRYGYLHWTDPSVPKRTRGLQQSRGSRVLRAECGPISGSRLGIL